MSNLSHEDGHDDSRQSGRSVGECHQGARKVGRNINVVAQEATEHASDGGDSGAHKRHRSSTLAPNVAESQQTAHWHHGGDQSGRLPRHCCGNLSTHPQRIQGLAQHHTEEPHGEEGNGSDDGVLLDVELEHLLHVERQFDQQHVPAPIVAGVRDQDGPEGSRDHQLLPRHWVLARTASVSATASRRIGILLGERGHDHAPLLLTDQRLLVRIVLDEPCPEEEPDNAQSTHHVEDRLPAQAAGQNAGHQH